MIIITVLALISIDYEFDGGEIILTIDSSLDRWDVIFSQVKDKRKYLSRYESGLWNDAERNYDVIKRECRGIFKAFKEVRF